MAGIMSQLYPQTILVEERNQMNQSLTATEDMKCRVALLLSIRDTD